MHTETIRETDRAGETEQSQRPFSIFGLLAAAGFLVCLFSLTGFAGRWSWMFEITSHFRPQYFVILFGLAAVFVCRRQLRTAAVFCAFAAINFWLLTPFLFGTPALARLGDPASIRLLAWNVHSSNRNFEELHRLLERHQPDLVLLLEVVPDWEPFLSAVMTNYLHQLIEARDDNFGIAVFSRLPETEAQLLYLGRAGLPSIALQVPVGGHPLTLLGTHPLPPAGRARAQFRDEHLTAVAAWANQQTNQTVVAGDLNITPWSPVFSDLLTQADLHNGAAGRGLSGTWPAFFPPMLIPIDHFLHSEEVVVTRREIVQTDGSDHLPQIVDFGLR